MSDPLNTTGIAMPPKGGNPALTDGQIVDIVAYLRSIQK
jgi:disulfide bond formation protein DsbB